MKSVLIGLALFALLFVSGCGKDATATHKRLQWDSNVEIDMKEYRVYQCTTSPCLASTIPFATVPHLPAVPNHSVPIPDTDHFYVVYAVDLALNISPPSVTLGANLAPPAVVTNVRIL